MNRLAWSPCVIVLALTMACGSNDEAPSPPVEPAAGGGGGAGGEGGGGGAAPLPCATDITWRAGPSLDVALDHHMTFVMEADIPYLFVAGGQDYGSMFDEVRSAPIVDDGSVGAWSPSAALPYGRAGSGVVTHARHVVLVGGRTIDAGLVDVADVIVGEVSDGGTIAAWADMPPIPEPRFHLAAVIDADRIFVTGGLGDGGVSQPDVYTASVDDAGQVSSWSVAGTMTRPRSHHTSWIDGGYLYVAGGLDGDPAGAHTSLQDVERAPVDGADLGTWETVEGFPTTLATGAATVRGECVYQLAGIEGGTSQTDTVYAGRLDGDGLGAWRLLPTTLPQPRSHMHQAPTYDGRVYVVGGSTSLQTVTDQLVIGTFVDP